MLLRVLEKGEVIKEGDLTVTATGNIIKVPFNWIGGSYSKQDPVVFSPVEFPSEDEFLDLIITVTFDDGDFTDIYKKLKERMGL